MEDWLWEGATSHPNTRLWPASEPGGDELTRSMDVARRLFYASLRVFGDSVLTYAAAREEKNPSPLRFYPPVILTFWSGFEAFIRHSSGAIDKQTRYQPVLDRYTVLLKYGFGYIIDRGNKYWQALEKAKDLRDYYTHVEAMNSRSLSSDDVLDYMEAVMLGIIWPSTEVQSTLQLGIHDLYWIWDQLRDLSHSEMPDGHIEQPFFHSWKLDGRPHHFYCPFTNVDNERFPNTDEEMGRPPRKRPK